MPNKNLAFVADEYCSGVENFINDCSLAIHLVSHTYGLVPEGTDKSIVVLQNEIAAKQSISRGLNRLIWIPPSTHPEDARQQNFIDQLKCNEDLQTGADLLEGTIEELKFSIFDTLRKLEEKEKEMEKEKEKEKAKENVSTADAEAIDDVPKMIYLVCDKRDLDAIKPLEDFLFNSGYEIMLPVFDGEESQLRSEHEENLKQCDAVILYYGNANELWLRSMTRDLLRMPALGRTRNLLSKTAIIAEPSSPQKERFRSHELSVINMLQGFRPEMMDDFIKNLK